MADLPCVWCGRTYAEHAAYSAGGSAMKFTCGLLRDCFKAKDESQSGAPIAVPPATFGRPLNDAELGALTMLLHKDIVVAALRAAATQAGDRDYVPSEASERLEAELKRRGVL